MFDDLSSEVINLVCFVFVVLSSTPVTNPSVCVTVSVGFCVTVSFCRRQTV